MKKILHEAIDDPTKEHDIENIITWSTVFEDAAIFKTELAKISWLDSDTIKALSNIRYRGWGQFSRKLLDGLKLGNGHTVIQELMLSNHNLMQILTDETLKTTMAELNQDKLKADDIEDVINDAYTSPSNKKALRQVLRVVEDIKHAANGQDPSWLYIETADGPGTAGKRTQSRQKQIQTVYANAAQELIDSAVRGELEDKIADKASFTDRLVLYFMQGGRDIYTGAPLNIDQLSHYDIDHILPQSLIKDDSLDNRVLVNATINREKNNVFASTLFASKMAATWRKWHEAGLISGRKLRNLMLRPDEIDKFAHGFVARQLVETRQIIKLTEQIAAAQYPNTKIIAVKAGLSHQLREELDFPKNRDVNHYHHAFDAFLAARIGTYLLKRYPKLAPFFTYGEFAKVDVKKFREFNFIGALTHAKKNIVAKDTGEIVWDKERDIQELDRIYNFKRMLITHEVYFETADLFKQTIYAAKDSKERGGSKQLIPKKQGYPTQVYGGYTRENTAYLAVVKTVEKKADVYRVVRIATSQVAALKEARAQSTVKERELLKKFLTTKFTKIGKNGKKAITPFDIVIPRVPREQLFHNKRYGFFMVNSDTLMHNYQELWMSRSDQQILSKLVKSAKTVENGQVGRLFENIVEQINKYFPLYDINQFRKKLDQSKDIFSKLPLEGNGTTSGKRETIQNILTGAGTGAKNGDLKNLGIKTPFGFLQVPSGIVLDDDTTLIYQSPTGMLNRIVRLSEL